MGNRAQMELLLSCEAWRDVIGWDVSSWKQAVLFWEKSFDRAFLVSRDGPSVGLELGSWTGGLSTFFALKGGSVVCSDSVEEWPRAEVVKLHEEYDVQNRVSYREVNASEIDFPDNHFDFVCFKSILGAIGRNEKPEEQRKAITEMHRVLKPGGKLFFAENTEGSCMHMFLRRKFVKWGDSWRYLKHSEVAGLFEGFSEVSVQFCGFFALLGINEFGRNALCYIDKILDPLIADRNKYIVYGVATK